MTAYPMTLSLGTRGKARKYEMVAFRLGNNSFGLRTMQRLRKEGGYLRVVQQKGEYYNGKTYWLLVGEK